MYHFVTCSFHIILNCRHISLLINKIDLRNQEYFFFVRVPPNGASYGSVCRQKNKTFGNNKNLPSVFVIYIHSLTNSKHSHCGFERCFQTLPTSKVALSSVAVRPFLLTRNFHCHGGKSLIRLNWHLGNHWGVELGERGTFSLPSASGHGLCNLGSH